MWLLHASTLQKEDVRDVTKDIRNPSFQSSRGSDTRLGSMDSNRIAVAVSYFPLSTKEYQSVQPKMLSQNGTEMAKTTEQRQQEAENDLNSLSRVSHRLAMVNTTEKLLQVLDKLLPCLLECIGENHKLQLVKNWDVHARIHNKLVEMLSHTMKRVREDRQCHIPCLSILELLVDPSFSVIPDVDPFTLNLSLAFLTLGLSRYNEWESLLPGLLAFDVTWTLFFADTNQTSPLAINQIAMASNHTLIIQDNGYDYAGGRKTTQEFTVSQCYYEQKTQTNQLRRNRFKYQRSYGSILYLASPR